jgi:hypothetical protein
MPNNKNAAKNLKNFNKGFDARRNLSGRPRGIEGLRAIVLTFLNEPTGRNKTRLWRQMERMEKTDSGRRTLWEYGYGKVPDKLESAHELPIENLVAVVKKVEKEWRRAKRR